MADTRNIPWSVIEPLFHEALEHPESEWPALLSRSCAGNPALQREVLSLLQAAGREHRGLDNGVQVSPAVSAGARSESTPMQPGTRIGAYLLVRAIGQGGMGEVFLAERADGQFQQQVAIKFLKLTAAVHLQRFNTERQILAGLSHPGIARLLDGGLSDDGRPYMVMEHVDGLPVTAYAARARLPLDAVLALFEQICAAVAEAHANLVIHRDLKPDNILVNDEGQIKLLDFGVAKILSAGMLENPATRATPLTPSHAAPEQLSGKPVTTGTDIYALGVLLYELLSGVSPWVGLRELPLSIAIKQLLESEATAVSEAAASAGRPELRQRLEGDLDAIVARCLRKSPADRYRSVDALREDLRRYREGFPVHARAGHRSYRFGRFLRRNRWPLVGACALVLLLAGFSLRFGIEAERAVRAERAAHAEAETANAVTDYLVSLFETASPTSTNGQPFAAKSLIDAGLSRLDTHLRDRPSVRTRMLATLSQMYNELGYEAEAVSAGEAALALIESPQIATPDRARVLMRLGSAYDRVGRSAEAIVMLQRAVLTFEDSWPANKTDALRARWYLGSAYLNNDAVDRGLAELKLAHSLAADSRDAKLRAEIKSALALAYSLNAEGVRAMAMQREAMDELSRVLGKDHPATINAYATLGHIAYYADAFELAAESFDLAITHAEPIYGPDSSVVLNAHSGLANALSDLGKVREAIAIEQRVVAINRRVSGENPALATLLNNLATDLNRYGDYAAAEIAARQARAMLDPGSGGSEQLRSDLAIADALNRMGLSEQALAHLDLSSINSNDGLLGDGFRGVLHMYRFDALLDLSRTAEAGEELIRAAELLASSVPSTSKALIGLRYRRAQLALAQGQSTQGLAILRQVLSQYRGVSLRENADTLEVQAAIADALIGTGEYTAARNILARISPLAHDVLAPSSSVHLQIADAQRRLQAKAPAG